MKTGKMKTNKNLKYWLGFSKLYSIGTIHLKKMLSRFGSIEESWHATASDLLGIEGFHSSTINKFTEEKKSLKNLEKLEEEILEKNIKVITLEDENYPSYLKEIYDPPITLFIKGSLDYVNQDNCLAVVGSRKASHYIQEVLKKIIRDLKNTDITIVSGLATGVDTCAHSAAVDNGMCTIAVLASGFDHIYPASNKQLFRNIVENNGAVITEYFPDTQPLPMRFPRRNRIISGLSQGTLVAEAGLKSGALITANLCLEQNRELMCIPGMVTNPNTEGIHKLIKEGAAVVTRAEDILNLLGWQITSINNTLNKTVELNLLDNEKKIYDILDLGEPVMFDKLVEKSKLSVDELMTTLTSMELNGIITQLPGQKFVKNLN